MELENCDICGLNYKYYKSDHLKSVKHQESMGQYYCKKCHLYMLRADKDSHLNSNGHKSKNNKIWCEDCDKEVGDSRHFQSGIHLRNQQNTQRASGNQQNTQSASGNQQNNFILDPRFSDDVELIMNETAHIKLKINPTENLEYHINDLLSENYFPRCKFQLSYLAKFSKIVNGKERVFKRWIQSDLIYNHLQSGTQYSIHNTLMQKLDDEQLEGSGFQFQEIEVLLQIYKVRDIQASSWVELPKKYKDSKSIINIENNDQYCFLWCILAHLHPAEDHKNRTSKYYMYKHTLYIKDLEFPMKGKDIPTFERLNILNLKGHGINVFELTGNILTPIYINKNYLQPQIDLMLYENHCLITKLHCLINKSSHMEDICRRCLTAFSSQPVLNDHIEHCQKQQPSNISFSWKDHLKFEDYHESSCTNKSICRF